MSNDYGQWAMVAFDVVLVGWGARGLFHPRSRSDWGALGGMWAFLVALYAEMYGFPLTVYLLEGPLGSRFPQIRPTFAGGHIWNDLIGWRGTPQLSPFHLASYVLLAGGFWLTGTGWAALWRATRNDTLATDCPYSRLRHPQYAGFVLVMAGFLLQWPTIPTLVMFPLLAFAYRRLARREEHHQATRFGAQWDIYAGVVPRWWPRLQRPTLPLIVRWGWASIARRREPGDAEAMSRRASGRSRAATNPLSPASLSLALTVDHQLIGSCRLVGRRRPGPSPTETGRPRDGDEQHQKRPGPDVGGAPARQTAQVLAEDPENDADHHDGPQGRRGTTSRTTVSVTSTQNTASTVDSNTSWPKVSQRSSHRSSPASSPGSSRASMNSVLSNPPGPPWERNCTAAAVSHNNAQVALAPAPRRGLAAATLLASVGLVGHTNTATRA